MKSEKAEPKYDVALSFAGEEREYVDEVANVLKASGIKVFYDRFQEAKLWGKDLVAYLKKVYRDEAKYVIMFCSENYAQKNWPNHERESALERLLTGEFEYILPARFDDTEIPGLSSTRGYIDLRGKAPNEFCLIVKEKLGLKSPDGEYTENDCNVPGNKFGNTPGQELPGINCPRKRDSSSKNPELLKTEKACNEFDWGRLLGFIQHGRVIPVIGKELYLVENEKNEKVPLYEYLAHQISLQLNTPPSKSTDLNFSMACSEYLQNYQNEYWELLDILKKTLKNVRLCPESPIYKLARIKNFSTFFTTAHDNFLADTVENIRKHPTKVLGYTLRAIHNHTLDYKDNEFFEAAKKHQASLVYHVLGNIDTHIDPAFTDFDIQNSVFQFIGDIKRYKYQMLEALVIDRDDFLFLGFKHDDLVLQLFAPLLANRQNLRGHNYIFLGGLPATSQIQTGKLPYYLQNDSINVAYSCDPIAFVDCLFERISQDPEAIY